jgi:hypothetical protein
MYFKTADVAGLRLFYREAGAPRHSAAVVHSPERQASITIEAVPAEVGDLESFAAHGFHGIPEDCLHMSDFYEHARSESAQQMGRIR